MANTNFLKNTIIILLLNFKNTNKYLGLEEILINYNNVLGKNKKLDEYINEYQKVKNCGRNRAI